MTVDRIALATSNGTGMGHLSRQLSVALAMDGRADPVLFSLSRALPVIRHYPFPGEYCPSRERDLMPRLTWQQYLRERLRAFVEETGVRTVVFDGVVPYRGLLRARLDLPDVAFVWMRRGFWRPGVSTEPLHAAGYFDLVLEPGDLAAAGDHGPTSDRTDALRLSPISLLEHTDLLPRAQAAAELGLDPDRPTALLTLSSGALNDVATPGKAALDALLADPAWQIAVTRSALSTSGLPIEDRTRCVELRDVYPIARYLNAFDGAVAAGGYNSVHELMYAGVPTLFVPNPSSGTDDQTARTRWLADKDYALFADQSDHDAIRAQIGKLREAGVRDDLRAACAGHPRPSGSAEAAKALLDLPRDGHARPPAVHALKLRGFMAAVRLLGTRGAGFVQGRLRPGSTGYADTPPVFSEEMTTDLVSSERPFEHLLPGTSERYAAARRRIAGRYFARKGATG